MDRWGTKNQEYHDRTASTYERSIRPTHLPAFVFDYKKYLGFLNALPSNARILDVGAGTGDFCSEMFAKGFSNLVALDISQQMLQILRRDTPTVLAIQGDATELPFADSQFDFINVKGALHHVHATDKAIQELLRCLRPGGYLRIQEPHSSGTEVDTTDLPIERPLNVNGILDLLDRSDVHLQTVRLFPHFQTNDFLSSWISSPELKNFIARITGYIRNLFRSGDIFLIIARKLG